MQSSINQLVQLGVLPNSDCATVSLLEKYERLLSQVTTPVTDDEALVLVDLIGSDDCFGLAWTIVHLIETSPSWPISSALSKLQGEWADVLKERAL